MVNGKDLFKMSDSDRTKRRQRTIGFVFQEYDLRPSLTALGNVEIARDIAGVHGALSKEVDDILRLIGISSRMNHKPQELSGGEQQRVVQWVSNCLAAAICRSR